RLRVLPRSIENCLSRIWNKNCISITCVGYGDTGIYTTQAASVRHGRLWGVSTRRTKYDNSVKSVQLITNLFFGFVVLNLLPIRQRACLPKHLTSDTSQPSST